MTRDMQHYADLLLPLVRTLEMQILAPVYPDAYSQLLVVEGDLCVFVETSKDPLHITGYKLLTPPEIEDGSWKDTIRPRVEEKFQILAAWKNGETVQ